MCNSGMKPYSFFLPPQGWIISLLFHTFSLYLLYHRVSPSQNLTLQPPVFVKTSLQLFLLSPEYFLPAFNLWHPLQHSCLENPTDGGAWWSAVHGVAEGRTRPSNFTFTFHFHAVEKEMAPHSSVLAWRIPGMGSLVGYSPWGR